MIIFGWLLRIPTPVSYTHLDVYKRQNVIRIKAPYAFFGKVHIPQHKKKGIHKNGRQQVFPVFIECYFFIKTQQQGKQDAQQIDQEVCIMWIHEVILFF